MKDNLNPAIAGFFMPAIVYLPFIPYYMDFYTERKIKFTNELALLQKRYNLVSLFRFFLAVLFFVFGYYSLKPGDSTVYLILMALIVAIFLYVMRYHSIISDNRLLVSTLLAINENEIAFLEKKGNPFDDGLEFTNPVHAYSHDLDIFGKNSLFAALNRTETYRGKTRLASKLLKILSQDEIVQNQEAVKELAGKPEWRQEIMAFGRMKKDSATSYKKLTGWIKTNAVNLPEYTKALSFIGPALVFGCLIAYLFTNDTSFLKYSSYAFGFNLLFVFRNAKLFKNEVGDTTEIYEMVRQYGRIIELIEKESFSSKRLKALQSGLEKDENKAGKELKKLSELLSRMDTIDNLAAAMVLNGLFLFHLHTFKALLDWKKRNAEAIINWLEIIGEFEALGSFGNLYYNNPDFVFPELNNKGTVFFKDVAHPLLDKKTRVGNDVNFEPRFTILTGSNMSGKSTFLRTLGVNMVLAGAGAPVCATGADIQPLPVLVSMRLSDSLSDSESYFFAEIKRLKQIMDALHEEQSFVLLDEILRGTNSDDKRTGTIEVVKKMVAGRAIGAIATHDIEVCNITADYPDSLINRCFEVETINDELYFDYKLRNGICKNKSATFLMKKTGVI